MCRTWLGTSDAPPLERGADSQVLAESHASSYVPVGRENSVAQPRTLSALEQVLEKEIAQREQELRAKSNAQRRTLEAMDGEMMEDCKELAALFGVPWVVAPMEAEAQCGALEQLGLVDGVVTEDSDVFLVGAVNAYKNLFRAGAHPEHYNMTAVERTLGFSRGRVIQFALLVGSDYTVGLRNVGIVLAVEILAAFAHDAADAAGDDVDRCVRPLERFRDWFADASDETHPALRKRLASVKLPPDFPSRQVVRAYLEPTVERSPQPFEWAPPRWAALKAYAMQRFQWAPERCDSVLDPIAVRLDELRTTGRLTQTRMLDFFSTQSTAIEEPFESVRLNRALAALKGEPVPRATKAKRARKRANNNEEEDDESSSESSGQERPSLTKQARTVTKAKRAPSKTAYQLFRDEAAVQVREADPELNAKQVASAVAAQWRLLGELDRAPYAKRAAEARAAAKAQKRTREVSQGPPFERDALLELKMAALRDLCLRFGLKAAVRKADVVEQLCMLQAVHRPVAQDAYERSLSATAKRHKAEAAQDQLDAVSDVAAAAAPQTTHLVPMPRAAALTLWGAIVAQRLQWQWPTALTLGAAVADSVGASVVDERLALLLQQGADQHPNHCNRLQVRDALLPPPMPGVQQSASASKIPPCRGQSSFGLPCVYHRGQRFSTLCL